MATDIEDSDRISPKKQRTLLSQTNDCNESNSPTIEDDKTAGPSESLQENYDEEKKRKLLEWQAWQLKKAFEDNSLNDMIIPIGPDDNTWYEIITELNMENQAVSMAIQNHGLVCPDNLANHAFRRHAVRFVESRSAERRVNLLKNPVDADSTHSFTITSDALNEDENSIRDRLYENDQQEDFLLEQAVAEAIKKKGLSALTVDYG